MIEWIDLYAIYYANYYWLLWLQGYFRKGAALEGLCCYEEAAHSYVQCLVLEPDAEAAKTALTNVSFFIN